MLNNASSSPTEASQLEGSVGVSHETWQNHTANPFNWPRSKKWTLTLVTASVTLLVGLNATAVTTPSLLIAESFHVSDENFSNSFWPVTVWSTGAALGPMFGLPLLENFGNRYGYLVSYVLFTFMVVPQAVAQNFATLLVTRAIAGAFGGILQNAMEMFVADIWFTEDERDIPVTLYLFALLAGVTVGPAFGAIINHTSWRWVFYAQLIIYCVFFPLVLLVIDETRGSVIRARLAKKDPRSALAASEEKRPAVTTLLYDATSRPTILLCTEPVVFFLTLWSAFAFGLVFISTQSVAQVYSTNYGFTDSATGLVQLSLFVGEVIGFLACLPQNRYYQRSATFNPKETGVPIPEARLPLSIPTSLIGLAGGLFWYGWSSFPHVHWIVPSIGLAFVGFAIMVIVTTVSMYITDAYAKYAGSAIAAVAFGENIFAAWLPLSAKSLYTNLGFQWASSLLGFIALALTLAPIGLLLKGEKVREKSKFINKASYT